MSLVLQYVDSRAAVITLNDSENGNRLSLETLQELTAAFEKSFQDPAVRVILLRSGGRTFCSGMDLVKFQNRREDEGQFKLSVSLYAELLLAIHTSAKPVICLLCGDVKAGGVGLVCACDIVLASPEASFELSEVLLGLIPANVLPYLLTLRLPPQKARYLVLTSRRISAEEAYRLNLIDELFDEAELEKGARRVVKRLMRSCPAALAETKSFSRAILGKDLDEARRLAWEKLLELSGKPETAAAIRAFNEGNVPEWFERFKPARPLFRQESQDAPEGRIKG